MLIKIGNCWVEPNEISAIYPNLTEFGCSGPCEARVILRGSDRTLKVGCLVDEAVDALRKAGYIEEPLPAEHPEPVSLDVEEVEVLQTLLAYGYEWVARDESGPAFAYWTKPHKDGSEWVPGDPDEANRPAQRLPNDRFRFLDWDDAEAHSIRELLGVAGE